MAFWLAMTVSRFLVIPLAKRFSGQLIVGVCLAGMTISLLAPLLHAFGSRNQGVASTYMHIVRNVTQRIYLGTVAYNRVIYRSTRNRRIASELRDRKSVV